MRVRFTRPFALAGQRFQPGSVGDLTDELAQKAIEAGAAEELDPMAGVATNEEGEPVMRLRFRHGHSVAGKAYLAGEAASVPISDEAWQAVNEGHADLVPPPGEAGQPFPPEELTEAEVPLPASAVQQPVVQATPAETAQIRARQTDQAAQQEQEEQEKRAAAKSAAQPSTTGQPGTPSPTRIETTDQAKQQAEQGARQEGARTPGSEPNPPPQPRKDKR